MSKETTIIGIDLGGTKIALARFNAETWEMEAQSQLETHADRSFDLVLDDLVSASSKLQTDTTKGIGIGVPGLVTQPQGIIVTLPNIPGAENVALERVLKKRTGLNVKVDNDANCFALAEALLGAGKGLDVVIGITMGTGVGGGIVIDGKIFSGSHGYAAEIGHMLLMPGKPPFETQDKRGDIEQFLSGTALGKRCRQAQDPKQYLEGETCAFLHDELYREIAWMCTNLIHLIDPSIIIFGGGAGRALKPHLPDIERELKLWTLTGTPLPKLAIATLENAGVLGAGLLVGE